MAIKAIRKAAVIGGGVMGRGIAAHLANARIPVVLLDIVPRPGEKDDVNDPAFRNKLALNAIEAMKKEKPSAIYSTLDLDLITPGNVEDHLELLKECDWIVEAVPETMAIKTATFEKIEKNAGPDAIISSNTSGLSIKGMLEGRSESFKKRFIVTHFFNPVRYMKLLEIVPAEETDPAVTEAVVAFGRDVLGKGIVFGKDTTNFIANRIGVHGMMTIMHTMPKYGLSVEEVDAIFAKPMGRPKSAVFRTADVVGLDTFTHVAKNCYDTLTADEERSVFEVPSYMKTLVERGWTGSKAKQGFFKKVGKDILSLDLETLEYGPKKEFSYDSLNVRGDAAARVKGVVVNGKDKAAEFAKEVTLRSLAYSARRMGEIADDVVNIDKAMRWGFNWDLGPFQTWDAIGLEWGFNAMKEAGIAVPAWIETMVSSGHKSFYGWDGATPTYYDPATNAFKPFEKDEREISLEILKKQEGTKIFGNMGATLHDIGDGVALLEFHTKMNAIDDDIINMMHQAIDEVEANFEGLVIGNGSDNFSAGANLMLVLMNARAGNWSDISMMIDRFQQANQRMRFSPKPVVAAPTGLTLGGGAEVSMGANAIQAAGELYMGLVEVGVGLIPGGSGTLQLLRNHYGRHATNKDVAPMAILQNVFMAIGMAKVATSAEEARELGFLSDTDIVTINRDHLLYRAKQRVLGMARAGFVAPRPMKFRLPGADGAATIETMLRSMESNNQISAHDRHIGVMLGRVLTGGDTTPNVLITEQKLLELEKEAFLSLCGEEKSQARMEYMLMNNKPLRN
jgi:3-hydroxyacyl-CoA dehydrogenase